MSETGGEENATIVITVAFCVVFSVIAIVGEIDARFIRKNDTFSVSYYIHIILN